MHTVYRAQNNLDAHLIKNLLEQQGINSFIHGEFLQGGMGELPAGSLIQVQVNNDDVQQALAIIADWEQEQPDIPAPPNNNHHGIVMALITGLLLGMGLMHFLQGLRFS